MRRFIPLFLAAVLSIPSIAATSSVASYHDSNGTRWALFGRGRNHSQKAAKAPKTVKAPKTKKAPKAKKAKR